MSLIETRRSQIFPTLIAPQIAVMRRFASGPAGVRTRTHGR